MMKSVIKKLAYLFNLRPIKLKGVYPSWEEAKRHAESWDSELIINKVKDSALKVKNGEAAYERDSVLFYKKEYPFTLIAGLLRIAAMNNGKLNVLDFGGSLGSTYYQCRDFLTGLEKIKWNIVEQEKFVKIGRELFEDKELKFYFSIEECLEKEKPYVIIFSGVLQYLENYYEILEKAKSYFTHIIVVRTPFAAIPDNLITLEVVPPSIYKATYPMWIFSNERFMKIFQREFTLIAEFPSVDGSWNFKNIRIEFKGYIFEKTRRKNHGI
jgi:putative methyltransferase (TIGR04325 family)